MVNYNIKGFTLNQIDILKHHGQTEIAPDGNYELLKHMSKLNIVEAGNGDYIIYGRCLDDNKIEYRIENLKDYEQIKDYIL